MALAKRMATQHAVLLLLDGQLGAAARLARALAAVGASLAAMVAGNAWQLPPQRPNALQGMLAPATLTGHPAMSTGQPCVRAGCRTSGTRPGGVAGCHHICLLGCEAGLQRCMPHGPRTARQCSPAGCQHTQPPPAVQAGCSRSRTHAHALGPEVAPVS